MINATPKQLKVAVVGPYPVNFNLVSGGIQAVVRNLVQGLNQRPDLEVHVITVDFDRTPEAEGQPDGIHLHVKPASQAISQWLFYYHERQWIQRMIDQIQPDIIHVHGTNFYGYAVRQQSCPTLVTVHGVLEAEAKLKTDDVGPIFRAYRWAKGYFNSWFEEQTLRKTCYATTISPYVGDMLQRFQLDQLYPIDNPIDDIFFELDNTPKPGRILFAGVIHRRKGILHLLKAINQVRQTDSEVELHLAGRVSEPEYAELLHQYIQSERLESVVTFCGHLNESKLYRAFQECQVLVLPSEEEVSPMVVQQAMAMGKSVVATKVGGVPYLITDQESGLLVPYGDAEALAEALVSVLEQPELEKRLGENARKVAIARFKQEMICTKTCDAYFELA